MRGFSLKSAKSVVIFMHLLTHVTNLLLHQGVCSSLILEHHLHEIKLALHETSGA